MGQGAAVSVPKGGKGGCVVLCCVVLWGVAGWSVVLCCGVLRGGVWVTSGYRLNLFRVLMTRGYSVTLSDMISLSPLVNVEASMIVL